MHSKLFLIVALFAAAVAVVSAAPPTLTEPRDEASAAAGEKFLAAWEKLAEVERGFDYNSGCHCVKYTCGCCVDVDAKAIHFKSACINLIYLPDEIGIEVTFSINGKVYIHTKVSAKNPPALCIGIPDLKKEASVCLDFYDMVYSKSEFGGCVKLEVKFLHMTLADVKIGCFNIPLMVEQDDANTIPLIALEKAAEKSVPMQLVVINNYSDKKQGPL